LDESRAPLEPLVKAWAGKLGLALEYRKRKWGDDAEAAMFFYAGPYDEMYNQDGKGKLYFNAVGDDDGVPKVSFRVTANLVAEMVQIFGPALYHRNPVRRVTPRKTPQMNPDLFITPIAPPNPLVPQDPMQLMMQQQQQQMQLMQLQQQEMELQQRRLQDEARASLLEAYLNYTPNALDLKKHSRKAIDETLIKGMGVVVTQVYRPEGSPFKMVGSFYETADYFVLDPDMLSIEEAKWAARLHIRPYWEVEDELGLPRDTLKKKAGLESYNRQAELRVAFDEELQRRMGQSSDLIVYWEVWSKMGMGGLLSGVPPELREPMDRIAGKYVRLLIHPQCHYPLNLPPELVDAAFQPVDPLDPMAGEAQAQAQEQVQKATEWETPFWADGTWPFEILGFHDIPNQMYPMSHIKPALGELMFLNWAYSFLASKVKTASRDFIAIMSSAGEEIKRSIARGGDFTIIEITEVNESVDKVVKFLQHPEFNGEIYRVLEILRAAFERRTGLTELAYGMSSRQYRSAAEAETKAEQMSVRPDDMANKVEDWMSAVSRKEAFAARWHLTGQDVAPVLGPQAAGWWDQFIVASADMSEILHSLEYRIEAGSARKPNRATEAANMQSALQTLFQPLMQYGMQTGVVDPINALITAWAKAEDFSPEAFLLQPPPIPQPMPGQTPNEKPKEAA
jgi:hypothetical protein